MYKRQVHTVRGIRNPAFASALSSEQPTEPLKQGESIVCRCEDISLEELQALLDDHCLTLNQVKLASRATMGPCQGKTCISLILREIAAKTGKSVDQLIGPRHRVPIKPVTIGAIIGLESDKES